MAEAETAVKLDPTSLAINNILTVSLYMNREYDRALEQVRRTLELDPGYPLAHVNFAKAHLAQGHFAEALDHLERAGSLKYPDRHEGDLAYAYAKSGRRNDALRVLTELDQRARREGITLAPARAIASLGLGDIDRTFAWLDKAYEERDVALREIKCDPVYDAIRTDPRFARLLTQLKLK